MESLKINKLEIENVKRIKAVKIEPTPNGLTIVGGNNNQGKTSVLDSIAWALGGEKYRPSEAQRHGSVIPPNLHIVMNNGLVVERKGKNSSLKVIDPEGNKGGQQLLNEFVEQLALDLPKFMEASGKEKAETLLKIIGVGDQLSVLDKAQGGKRTMYTSHHPCWDAKNRYGLPEECEMDYSVIAPVIEETNTNNNQPVKKEDTENKKTDLPDFMSLPEANVDETVDYNTGEKIEEKPKQDPAKSEVFHIPDYVPKALQDLMYPYLVSEDEVMEAVYQRGYFPRGTPFQNLPTDFIDGVLIGAWKQVLGVIKEIRSKQEIPFDE